MLARRLAVLGFVLLPATLSAQQAATSPTNPWTLRLRAAISGTSHDSQPAGYKIYSAIALEAALERRVSDVASLELSLRTESREVLGPTDAGADNRLGSLEMLPLTLLGRWRPRGGRAGAFQPYLGAGAALTATWEKSGALDSSDVPASLRPALGLGTDYEISPRVVLNADVKWNPLTARVVNFRTPEPTVKIDPMTFGLGMGVRF